MEQYSLTLYDILQIVLFLSACWACRLSGYYKGISDTLGFFEDKGIIDLTDDAEVIRKAKDQEN